MVLKDIWKVLKKIRRFIKDEDISTQDMEGYDRYG
jgi:hypothetical protein